MSVSVILRYSIAAVYAIALGFFSLIPGDKAESLSPWDFVGADKLVHFIAYGLLSFLVMYAVKENLGKKNWRIVLISCIIYGIVLECMQYVFFTGRHFEFLDIMANIIGCILGILVFNKLNK